MIQGVDDLLPNEVRAGQLQDLAIPPASRMVTASMVAGSEVVLVRTSLEI